MFIDKTKHKRCMNNVSFLKRMSSDFSYLNPSVNKIYQAIKKYEFADVIKAVFCINLWRKNRSALAQGLSLNMALTLDKPFGTKAIKSYSDFEAFYQDISPFMTITPREDYIVDDYGEVFINHNGKTYPVLVGTGHQQVYGALRFMQTLASQKCRDEELTTLLEYVNTIISCTKKENYPNVNHTIAHELPPEAFWNSVIYLFNDANFQLKLESAAQILGHQYGPIEMRHFVNKGGECFPLFNSSILLDYYKILLESSTQFEKKEHVIRTLYSIVENSFNFSHNTPNRILIAPIIIDRVTKERIIPEGLLFAGLASNGLLIVIDSTSKDTNSIIKRIHELNRNKGLCLVEPHYRPEYSGLFAVELEKEYDIIIACMEPFTDILSHTLWAEQQSQGFKCTALDMLYMIGFSNTLSELIDFIRYDQTDNTEIFSFGGKSNLFFTWKNASRLIASGAIEYDSISLDYNESENFTYRYFAEKLCEYPRLSKGLFVDPLNWKADDATMGYISLFHKGCRGFGGELKHLSEHLDVFLAHNVAFFEESDFEQNNLTALKTIDELNQRLFLRYSDILDKIPILQGKVLQMLYMPWTYAAKKYSKTFLNDSSRSLVFSDEHIEDDSLIIRYSINPDLLMRLLREAPDRRAENLYFKELLNPLQKYAPDVYKELEDKLCGDSPLKKTVGVFHIERHYYFSNRALDVSISPACFARVRKAIAQKCYLAGIAPGEYRGHEATSTIRKMQTAIVQEFEKHLAKYNRSNLHQRALSYFSVQQNGIILNLERYYAFTDLDEDIQHEFEVQTRELRERYRRHAETAKYLIESNLAVTHVEETCICTDGEFSFLLAFAEWLVTLQDDADTCHYTDFDLSIEVDSEYKINAIYTESSRAQYDELQLRKYNNVDYHIKSDAEDQVFLSQAATAFHQDTGIKLPLLLSLLEYLQLAAIQDGVAVEIYPNIFEISKQQLAESFNHALEKAVSDLNEIFKLIDFVTLDASLLKTVNGKPYDILPIWLRERRDNRFDVKPIIENEGVCVYSPVAINSVLTSWKNGILDWLLPYETGLTNLTRVLRTWKKRYEDLMVQDVAEVFRNNSYDLVYTEVDLFRRFPKEDYPIGLGDYDIIAVSKVKKELWIVESKVLQKVASIFKVQMQQKRFFYEAKEDEKFQRRIDYMNANACKVLKSFGVNGEGYKVIPYMVTNKVFMSRYKAVSFPIVTFNEIQSIINK